GSDTFRWNSGDGSDSVEGQDGFDTIIFNGSNDDEQFDISANGSHVRLADDVGGVNMDLSGFDGINVNALGGADTIAVNDLSGTDVTSIHVDLGGTPGGAVDGQADTVIVDGTANNDAIRVSGVGASYSVTGLPATVSVDGSEGAN